MHASVVLISGKINIPHQRWTRWHYRGNLSPVRTGLLDMKIVPKILAVVMTVNLVSPKPVKAVPVVVVPLVCAKVCVLIGTAIVGGATAYIWQHRTTKKKYLADVQGNVRRMIDDPEEELGVWEEPLNTAHEPTAKKVCLAKAKAVGAELIDLVRHPVTGKIICVFKGGDSHG